MDVSVGCSQRFGRGEDAPVHLLVVAAGREVLSCTGGLAKSRRTVPFAGVWEELNCQPCRSFWKRTASLPSL